MQQETTVVIFCGVDNISFSGGLCNLIKKTYFFQQKDEYLSVENYSKLVTSANSSDNIQTANSLKGKLFQLDNKLYHNYSQIFASFIQRMNGTSDKKDDIKLWMNESLKEISSIYSILPNIFFYTN